MVGDDEHLEDFVLYIRGPHIQFGRYVPLTFFLLSRAILFYHFLNFHCIQISGQDHLPRDQN